MEDKTKAKENGIIHKFQLAGHFYVSRYFLVLFQSFSR